MRARINQLIGGLPPIGELTDPGVDPMQPAKLPPFSRSNLMQNSNVRFSYKLKKPSPRDDSLKEEAEGHTFTYGGSLFVDRAEAKTECRWRSEDEWRQELESHYTTHSYRPSIVGSRKPYSETLGGMRPKDSFSNGHGEPRRCVKKVSVRASRRQLPLR